MKAFKALALGLLLTIQCTPVNAVQMPPDKGAAAKSFAECLCYGFLTGIFFRAMYGEASKMVSNKQWDIKLMRHPEVRGSLDKLAFFFLAIIINKWLHDFLGKKTAESITRTTNDEWEKTLWPSVASWLYWNPRELAEYHASSLPKDEEALAIRIQNRLSS